MGIRFKPTSHLRRDTQRQQMRNPLSGLLSGFLTSVPKDARFDTGVVHTTVV